MGEEIYVLCENCMEYVDYDLYESHCFRCNNDVNILEGYITSNSQIHRGNVRDFLRTHHSPPGESGLIQRFEEHMRGRTRISEYEANLTLSERIGKVEIGIKNIDKVSKVSNEVHDGVCPICQDELAKRKVVFRKLICNHVFCAKCIEKWLQKHKKCPVCMKDLE